VRVGLEVAQRGCEVAGFAAGEGEGVGGGADRGNVAVEVGKPVVEPGLLAVAELELRQPGQVVQVLAGVVEGSTIWVAAGKCRVARVQIQAAPVLAASAGG